MIFVSIKSRYFSEGRKQVLHKEKNVFLNNYLVEKSVEGTFNANLVLIVELEISLETDLMREKSNIFWRFEYNSRDTISDLPYLIESQFLLLVLIWIL